MKHSHAVAWIDQNEAHIIHFNAEESEQLTVHSRHRKNHLYHQCGQADDAPSPEDEQFYEEVSNALVKAEKVLIVGPANAKRELEKHMKHHAKDLSGDLMAVATVEQPTEGQILQMARTHFGARSLLHA